MLAPTVSGKRRHIKIFAIDYLSQTNVLSVLLKLAESGHVTIHHTTHSTYSNGSKTEHYVMVDFEIQAYNREMSTIIPDADKYTPNPNAYAGEMKDEQP